jgi:hypothetical protein
VWQPPAVDAQESLRQCPCWDKDDSLHESEEASQEGSIGTGASDNQVGVFDESVNDAALRFGIRFTTKQFHKSKLVELSSDVYGPNYQYKDVME